MSPSFSEDSPKDHRAYYYPQQAPQLGNLSSQPAHVRPDQPACLSQQQTYVEQPAFSGQQQAYAQPAQWPAHPGQQETYAQPPYPSEQQSYCQAAYPSCSQPAFLGQQQSYSQPRFAPPQHPAPQQAQPMQQMHLMQYTFPSAQHQGPHAGHLRGSTQYASYGCVAQYQHHHQHYHHHQQHQRQHCCQHYHQHREHHHHEHQVKLPAGDLPCFDTSLCPSRTVVRYPAAEGCGPSAPRPRATSGACEATCPVTTLLQHGPERESTGSAASSNSSPPDSAAPRPSKSQRRREKRRSQQRAIVPVQFMAKGKNKQVDAVRAAVTVALFSMVSAAARCGVDRVQKGDQEAPSETEITAGHPGSGGFRPADGDARLDQASKSCETGDDVHPEAAGWEADSDYDEFPRACTFPCTDDRCITYSTYYEAEEMEEFPSVASWP